MTLSAGAPAPASSAGNTSGLLFSPTSANGTTGRGSLELVLGPMFAGKTSELTRRLRRAGARGKATLLLKWAGDTRYADRRGVVVVTHDGEETRARSVERLEDATNLAWSYDVIGIDEGQFFEDLAEYAQKWAEGGATVIVAALDGDSQRRPFQGVLSLVPLAESVVKLSAVCEVCHENASFSMKLSASPQGDSPGVDVGGKEKYAPVCRNCYGASHAPATSPVRSMNPRTAEPATPRLTKSANRAARTRSRTPRSPLDDLISNAVPALSLR